MGFFRKEQIKAKRKVRRRQCGACGLWEQCNSPKMKATGQGQKKILVVGESLSHTEDRKGEQFSGKAGLLLKRKLKGIGVDLLRDCWSTNALVCKSVDEEGDSRKPTDAEIEYCRPSLIRDLKQKQPKMIILLGSIAIKSFLGNRWQKDLGGIDKWRGWAIPDKDYNCWVLPIFHPSHVLRSEKNPVVATVFNNDIKNIKNYIDKPFPELPDNKKCCQVLTKQEDVVEYLEKILKYHAVFAFDYETTGLKPQAKGHRIASVGMCWKKDEAVAWEWKLTPMKLYRRIMEDPAIQKIAANMKMEDHWTSVRARKIKINGWLWDTMNAAHVQDQRKGITSLKFDVYRRYGVVDYDSSINSYLKSNSKEFGANGFNNIFDAPKEDLLFYNASDAFYTYHLACDQMIEMEMII